MNTYAWLLLVWFVLFAISLSLGGCAEKENPYNYLLDRSSQVSEMREKGIEPCTANTGVTYVSCVHWQNNDPWTGVARNATLDERIAEAKQRKQSGQYKSVCLQAC